MKCEIRSQKVQFERYLNEKNDTGFARMITSFFSLCGLFISTVHRSLITAGMDSAYHIIECLCVVYLLQLPGRRKLCAFYGSKYITFHVCIL